MKSACDLLLYRTRIEKWRRGEKYADEGRVKLDNQGEKQIVATVAGSRPYRVELAFKGGGLSRDCNCPDGDFCKHLAAVAIVWDEQRGLPRPAEAEIENTAIPAPLVSYADIRRMFKNPLTEDLDILRMASSELGWSRPHARLPQRPKAWGNVKPDRPIDPGQLKQALAEVRQWTFHPGYDFYFCAGEMTAAFCEVLRDLFEQVEFTEPEVCGQALVELVEFQNELAIDLIDGSEGDWQISQAHLEELAAIVEDKAEGASEETEEYLEEFYEKLGQY